MISTNLDEFPFPPKSLSEDDLALAFADQYRDLTRYVPEHNAWYHADGDRWEKDETLMTIHEIRLFLRDVAKYCNVDDHEKRTLAKADTVRAIEYLARSDLAATAEWAKWEATM
jgi:putative DNA primase/helicase